MAIIEVYDAGQFYSVNLTSGEGRICGGNFYYDRKLLRPSSTRTKALTFAEAMEFAEKWAEELRGVTVKGEPPNPLDTRGKQA